MPLCVVQDFFCNEIVIYTDLASPMNNPARRSRSAYWNDMVARTVITF
jgi:hypothetical protein